MTLKLSHKLINPAGTYRRTDVDATSLCSTKVIASLQLYVPAGIEPLATLA